MTRWSATKIIATLGPASSTERIISELIKAGVDIFRLNFAHGDFKWHSRRIRLIRQASARLGAAVGIMQDLPGPKIRVGEVAGKSVVLRRGDLVVLNCDQRAGESSDIPVNYRDFCKDVRKGSPVYLDDGKIQLTTQKVIGKRVLCKVETAGVLTSHKGVNLPGTRISVRSLTAYDRECVEFGVKHRLDFIAMSFVRSAGDMRTLHRLVKSLDGNQFLIAKIEKREAVDGFDSILQETDGVMVARGDLGVEVPIEQVPGLQKSLIAKCNQSGIPVITATQVLESMVKSPRPTRAEATDAANAVLDGTDALMLSQETTIGEYPVEAVRVLKSIAAQAEISLGSDALCRSIREATPGVAGCLARSVCDSALQLGVKVIATPTRSGHTARLISRFRPAARIVAFSQHESTRRHLLLSWGVDPREIDQRLPFEELLKKIRISLVESRLVRPGELIIITAGSPRSRAGETNLMVIESI